MSAQKPTNVWDVLNDNAMPILFLLAFVAFLAACVIETIYKHTP